LSDFTLSPIERRKPNDSGTSFMWQLPSKEEEQHTFRTTLREHWWIWPECPRHAKL